jgi:uncharacterized protein YkwD
MSPRPSFSSRAAVLVLPLALAACNGSVAAGGPSSPSLDTEELAALAQINVLRGTAAVPLVTACTSLNVSASAHSDDMRDNGYLAEMSPVDGSTVRTRACKAGYAPSCTGNIPMAELVAEGSGTGAATVAQWAMDGTAGPILVQKDLVLAGIGRSIGADNERWTLDLASVADPSCN